MTPKPLIGAWIRRFLLEYLPNERNLSRNTQLSYRDTLLLLIPFIGEQVHKPVDQLLIDDLAAPLIQHFLSYVEQQRGCSIATRNQRLTAIHALARFVGLRSPEHIAWCTAVCAIPFKKTAKSPLGYLEKPDIEALLAVPDRRTAQGQRDYALLLFLYNTGARASEAAQLRVLDLTLSGSPSVRLLGKGQRIRHCPLWSTTGQTLRALLGDRPPSEPVFLNRRQQPITRFGIHALIQRTVSAASDQMPSLGTRPISAHSIRHTTAVFLLRAGVDINTIRAWLGHVSLNTTNIYAEVDLQMKASALARCEPPATAEANQQASWQQDPELMAFLKAL